MRKFWNLAPILGLLSMGLGACGQTATPAISVGAEALEVVAAPNEASAGIAPTPEGLKAAAGLAGSDGTSTANPVTAAKPAKAPKIWPPHPAPAVVAKQGNALASSASVYLKQHANNPVAWYPWGDEALQRARDEDKPIFLSIGYASCHWCHVMEHGVFEDPEVAAFLNKHMVAIKVDREERPDLDTVYMDAVQAMTGRGGWPMTVILTPTLQPFFGGTYFPKPRFMRIAKDAVHRFNTQRSEVELQGQEMHAKIAAQQGLTPQGSPLSAPLIKRMADRMAASTDKRWGGLGSGGTRFPTPIRWRFLMRAFRKYGDIPWGDAIQRTLDRMADGGIHDHIAGGFHRYTTEGTWLIPHFEKMLYDNAQIAALYIEAEAVFKKPRYGEVARDTLDFMLREMRDGTDKTGFFASWDADSGGHEGTYYIWSPEDFVAVAGDADGAALAELLGAKPGGNFEGKSVLTRRIAPALVAEHQKRPLSEIEAVFGKWQERLWQVRSKRVAPGLDKKVVTAWNGLALQAFARGAAAWNEDKYRQAAIEVGDFLWAKHRQADGRFFRVTNNGVGSEDAVLDDYAFVAVGYLDLFEATQDLKWLNRAKTLVDHANTHFSHPDGVWWLTAEEVLTPMGRRVDPDDAVRPAGTTGMIEATQRLAALTGDEIHYARADKALRALASRARKRGLGMAGVWDAALTEVGPAWEVVIAGDPADPRTQALNSVLGRLRASWTVKADVPMAGPDAATLKAMPPTRAKTGRDEAPRAYVCTHGTCKKPTADPAELKTQILDGWTR